MESIKATEMIIKLIKNKRLPRNTRNELYAHYIKRNEPEKVEFIHNMREYEENLEDVKINIGEYSPYMREVIENAVSYDISDSIDNDEYLGNIKRLIPLIENEYATYKNIMSILPKKSDMYSVLQELVKDMGDTKYIKTGPYINTSALSESISNLPPRIKDVYVDMSNTVIDTTDVSDMEEVFNFSKGSNAQILEFKKLEGGDESRYIHLVGGNKECRKLSLIYNSETQNNLLDVFESVPNKDKSLFVHEGAAGVYIPSLLYFGTESVEFDDIDIRGGDMSAFDKGISYLRSIL